MSIINSSEKSFQISRSTLLKALAPAKQTPHFLLQNVKRPNVLGLPRGFPIDFQVPPIGAEKGENAKQECVVNTNCSNQSLVWREALVSAFSKYRLLFVCTYLLPLWFFVLFKLLHVTPVSNNEVLQFSSCSSLCITLFHPFAKLTCVVYERTPFLCIFGWHVSHASMLLNCFGRFPNESLVFLHICFAGAILSASVLLYLRTLFHRVVGILLLSSCFFSWIVLYAYAIVHPAETPFSASDSICVLSFFFFFLIVMN
jgi:hypothetical protein